MEKSTFPFFLNFLLPVTIFLLDLSIITEILNITIILRLSEMEKNNRGLISILNLTKKKVVNF